MLKRVCEVQKHNTAYLKNGKCYSVDCGKDHKYCQIDKIKDFNQTENNYIAILKSNLYYYNKFYTENN